MKDHSFADFLVGALACISVLGFYTVLRETELADDQRRRRCSRWSLPGRQRRSSPEDDCRHCAGSGVCVECAPSPCRVCRGAGVQPRDEALVSRLALLWDGAA